jgi:phage tail-like protein
MRDSPRYFIFNKEDDFRRGRAENLVYTAKGGLTLIPGSEGAGGTFWSRLLDSREKETVWHRLEVQSESLGAASIRFTFYAAEERRVRGPEGETDLAVFLREAPAGREEFLAPYRRLTLADPSEALLHEVQGRYLWFKIELFGQSGLAPAVRRVKISLPRRSWLDYLPEIYAADPASKSFLERYLSIFSSLYDDLSAEIRQSARHFDPEAVTGDFLYWLADWIAVDDGYIWTEEKLRRLILNGARLYRLRGTRRGLAEMAGLYLGEEPFIVEHHQLEGYEGENARNGLIARLYGDDSYYFTVIVPEHLVPSPKEYSTLVKIIENAKPAHVEANVVTLKPYIFLDNYSYLGLNSVLGRYRPAWLDGFSALPFTEVVDSNRERTGER